MDAYYGLNSAKWSRVDNGQDEEPAGIIEPSGVVVVGTSQREKDRQSRANGVATSTALVERRVS